MTEDQTEETTESAEPAVQYVNTNNLPGLLQELKISLCVTTYQANSILLFSASKPNKMSMLMRRVKRPTGISLGRKFLAIASRHQLWYFAGALNLRDQDGNVRDNDMNFLPRMSHVTGYIDTHDMAWHGDTLIAVNTLYSCLSRFEPEWSFTPIWKPPFITQLVGEDRCHLNGICVDQNGPKFVTALGNTNTKDGWRENKANGGILIDVPSGEIVSSGISMPHSPRIYGGKLWMLESGKGSLQVVDPKTGKRETVIRFHGFLRGLAFFQHYAFVGVCKAREKGVFGDIPIEKEFEDLQCGIAVVNLQTGKQDAFIHFQKGVEELFDIEVLPGFINPYMVGFEDEEIDMIKIFQ